MLKLKRFPEYFNTTPGVILFKDSPVCYTLELPWLGNQHNISCIPKGQYSIRETYSPHFHKVYWEIENVSGRSGIRIHPANKISELKGCISTATRLWLLDNYVWANDSTHAYDYLKSVIEENFIETILIF